MKNYVQRLPIGNIGAFMHAIIEMDDPMEMTLIVIALEKLLENKKHELYLLKDWYKVDKSYKGTIKLTEEVIKYLTDMIESLKVKNEVVTLVKG